ncbi:MAG: Gldg family protein, partial [Allomuricauda sp.]
MGKFLVSMLKAFIAILLLNLLAGFVYTRFDLTEDRRYTLSEPAVEVVQKFDGPVIVDILLDGDIPAEFSKLKSETVQLMESFVAKNKNISYNLINPLEDETKAQETVAQLQSLGLQPANVTVEENGKVS